MWYALQVTVFSTVTYYYITEIAPEAHVWQILGFAYLLTYLVTKILSVLLDLVLLPRPGNGRMLGRGSQQTNQSRHIRRGRRPPWPP